MFFFIIDFVGILTCMGVNYLGMCLYIYIHVLGEGEKHIKSLVGKVNVVFLSSVNSNQWARFTTASNCHCFVGERVLVLFLWISDWVLCFVLTNKYPGH